MIWYADASFLFSAFGKDVHSRTAAKWLGRGADFPILISRLTILETEIAWRAALKDQRLSEVDYAAARRQLKQGLLEGILAKRELRPHQWFPQAHRISDHADDRHGLPLAGCPACQCGETAEGDGFSDFR
jgi:hypothetical protein